MRKITKESLITAFVLMAVSCSQTSERFAQKEHGKKFGIWEMCYNADEYDVYWPSLILADDAQGSLCEVKTERNWWNDAVIHRDTIHTTAKMSARIISIKSINDAKYYNCIKFQVTNSDNKYYPTLDHKFLFNEGQKDSISFSCSANDDHYFVPDRNISEQIVALLCEKKPINVKVVCQGINYEGTYEFVLEGSSKLGHALKLNKDRKIIANKEFKKADAKAEKEFLKIFE